LFIKVIALDALSGILNTIGYKVFKSVIYLYALDLYFIFIKISFELGC